MEMVDNEDDLNDSVESTNFAPNFPWIASATSSGILSVYNYETGFTRYSCCDRNENSIVKSLWNFNKNSETLQIITACMNGEIRIWDAKTGEPVKVKQ